MSDAKILSRRVLVWWDFFHLAKVWCPTARLTYLSKNLRKFSVSSYVRSLVSWVSLFSSLIFTKTFPLQSPGAHQLFFLSPTSFNPHTCVHILAVSDSNNSYSKHVSPWNCSNISCLKLDLSEQNLPFVMLNSIKSQYILPSMPAGIDTFCNIIWLKLFLSSLYLVQFFGSSLVRGHTDSHRNAATTPWLIRSCVDTLSVHCNLAIFRLVTINNLHLQIVRVRFFRTPHLTKCWHVYHRQRWFSTPPIVRSLRLGCSRSTCSGSGIVGTTVV
jgi:hypothetical protein